VVFAPQAVSINTRTDKVTAILRTFRRIVSAVCVLPSCVVVAGSGSVVVAAWFSSSSAGTTGERIRLEAGACGSSLTAGEPWQATDTGLPSLMGCRPLTGPACSGTCGLAGLASLVWLLVLEIFSDRRRVDGWCARRHVADADTVCALAGCWSALSLAPVAQAHHLALRVRRITYGSPLGDGCSLLDGPARVR
jgi:hypothetical protein